jgi:hypothetical protein
MGQLCEWAVGLTSNPRAQAIDGVEQLTAMSDKCATKVLQIRHQARQDRVVDLILSECC